MDLSQYTDDELMALAGGQQSPSEATQYSDEELLQLAGGEKFPGMAGTAFGRGMARPVIGTAQLLGLEENLGGTREQVVDTVQEMNRQGQGTGVGGFLGEMAGDPRNAAAMLAGPALMNPVARTLYGAGVGLTEPVTSTDTGERNIQRGVAAGTGAAAANILPFAVGQTSNLAKTLINKGAPGYTNRVSNFLSQYFTPELQNQVVNQQQTLKEIGVDVPLAFLGNEGVNLVAKGMAGTPEGSLIAKKSADELAKQLSRAQSSFITRTGREGGSELFKTGANTIKDSIVQSRRLKAAELYGVIKDKAIPPTLMKSLSKSPILEREMQNVANDPVVLELMAGAKPNSVAYLDAIKQGIDGKIGAAIRAGDNTTVKAYQQAKNKLITAVEQYIPDYKIARFAYEQDSAILDKFLGGKKGTINKIIELSGEEPDKAYGVIFSKFNSPQNISKTRQAFQQYGQEEAFDSLTRGYLSGLVTGGVKGRVAGGEVPLNKLITNERFKQLSAAIGDPEKVKLFQTILKAQDDVLKNIGYVMPRGSSPTTPLAETNKRITQAGLSKFGKTVSGISNVRSRLAGLAGFNAKEISEISQNPKFYDQLQEILFDPNSNWVKQFKAATPKGRGLIINDVIKQAATVAAPRITFEATE